MMINTATHPRKETAECSALKRAYKPHPTKGKVKHTPLSTKWGSKEVMNQGRAGKWIWSKHAVCKLTSEHNNYKENRAVSSFILCYRVRTCFKTFQIYKIKILNFKNNLIWSKFDKRKFNYFFIEP